MTQGFASAQDMTEQRPRVVELARDVYGYLSDYDPNCGFVVGEEGVLAIDSRATPALARAFLEDIRAVTDKPVRYVFLTHYHAVRVLGASAFGVDAVIASRATYDWIQERGAADFESEVRRFPRLFRGVDEVPGLTVPRLTFERETSLWFAGRELRLMRIGRGHTAGDAICWLPDCGVVFAGDLVENRCGVYAGDGYLGEWTETLERLRDLRPTALVPGRGAAVTDRQGVNAAIDATKDFLLTLLGAVGQGLAAGEDLRALYERADRAMAPRFGDWPIYRHVLPFDVARAHDELRGFVHPVVWTAERDAALWAALHGT